MTTCGTCGKELNRNSLLDRASGYCSDKCFQISKKQNTKEKPKQYSKGIDTMTRAEANLTVDGCLGVAVFQIDKYIWRDKDSDYEDFKKARDYCDWAIKLMEKENDS